MRKRSFNESIENLFFERTEQLNPREFSSEYRKLCVKYERLYNEVQGALPEKMHSKLMELSDTECEMEATFIDILYEQAFLEGAKFMRYLLQNEKPVISGTIKKANEIRERNKEQIKNAV